MPQKILRRFHWQNLNECKKCGEPHGFPYEGRSWWTFWEPDERGEPNKEKGGFNFSWHLFGKRKSLRVSFETGDGDGGRGWKFDFALPFLGALYFTVELPWNGKQQPEREWSLRYDWEFGDWGSLWWKFGVNPWESGPRYLDGAFDPADFVLGREKYACVDGESEEWVLRMPEGEYPVSVTRQTATWTRPRWRGVKTRVSYECKPVAGVPIPGKGENSWDCDEDAIFAMNCSAKSHKDAVQHFGASVMERRNRYGGDNWIPSASVKAVA